MVGDNSWIYDIWLLLGYYYKISDNCSYYNTIMYIYISLIYSMISYNIIMVMEIVV
jgi:hypothetical protein